MNSLMDGHNMTLEYNQGEAAEISVSEAALWIGQQIANNSATCRS